MFYLVDRSNSIVDAGGGWDEAAEVAQGNAGSFRASVIGRQLESCMVGDATKMFVRSALDAARLLGQTRVLPYRCDTPDERRRFEMIICPVGDGQVKVEHRLVSATPVTVRSKPHRALPMAGWRCSQCWQVRLIGTKAWIETDLEPLPSLAQDVCPGCASRLFDPADPSKGRTRESADDN